MIPFSPPHIDDEIINEVIAALKSGWITTGPRTKQFEKEISEYCGCKRTVAVNSATAGLEIMLRWFGVKAGDEVILPAYTYCATANVIIHCGAKPIMVDTNVYDFNISVKAIENAITSRTKVIIPVDLGGFPVEVDDIFHLVERPDIKSLFFPENELQKKLGRILVMTDAAHSFGAMYKGQKVGCKTDITVFSFHAVKNLTTAEGGAICLNFPNLFDNDEIYKFLCTYTLHGQNKDAFDKAKIGNWRYDVIEAGYKANMTDILSSIGLIELRRYDNETLVRRKKIFNAYSEAFKNYDWAILPVYETKDRTSSFHAYMLRIKGIMEVQRDEIIQKIFNREVAVNVHFQPLPLLSIYKKMGYRISDYPNSFNNYQNEISLPVFYDLTDDQLNLVIEAVVDSVNDTIK